MSSEKTRQRLTLARRLRARGVPLEICEDDYPGPPSPPLRVLQTERLSYSSLFDTIPGGFGCIVDLRITNHSHTARQILRFELQLEWEDPSFSWLPDPLETGVARSPYRFPGRESIEFTRDDVLNHHADLTTKLCHGDSIQGLLLGFGFRAMPDSLRHGDFAAATLNVIDQFENVQPFRVHLWVDRSARLRPPRLRRGKRVKLFENTDFCEIEHAP